MVMADERAADQPFLQGRAFVFASQYVNSLQGEMSRQYLEAAVHVLESPGVGIPVKVSAVKTIRKWVWFRRCA
jgi:hypothetical protein